MQMLRGLGGGAAAGILAVAAQVIGGTVDTMPGGDRRWPVMNEFTVSAGIRLDYRRIDLDVPLYDEGGTIRYRLVCRGGDDQRRDELEQVVGASAYLAHMICVLNVGDTESDVSLLSEDGSPARYSRGSFIPSSLVGSCGAYPEYGLVRNFRLRGFELRIGLSDVVSNGPAAPAGGGQPSVEYAVVTVSLRRDSTARTAKAEQPGYLDPRGDPNACANIRRGDEPRMCRDPDTFSWTQCPADWAYLPFPWENEAEE